MAQAKEREQVSTGLPPVRMEMVRPELETYLTMHEQLESMIAEARLKKLQIRAFDVRYATQGIPQIGKDFLYFPGGSYEVLETGNLGGPSASVQKLTYGKLVPIPALLLVEIVAVK